MTDFDFENDDSSAQFYQSREKTEKLFQQGCYRQAHTISKELTRDAKSKQNAVHYMHALFDQMRFTHGLLWPQATKDAAVELILLLQDEEQARRIQPNLEEGIYHWTCSQISSCAYDNLAEATGKSAGFNSVGMHECINDGMQVCRQTGKLECIKCFREYAAEVYFAADDLEMVRHQCQSLMEYIEGADNQDRRSDAHLRLSMISLLEGRFIRAEKDLEKSLLHAVGKNIYLPLQTKCAALIQQHTLHLLMGRTVAEQPPDMPEVPLEEWPLMELDLDRLKALAYAVTGRYSEASNLLTSWDRRLTESKCLSEWFEVRLRLIAVCLMNGNAKKAQALGKGLEAKAAEAQDFLTLRRWKRLLNTDNQVCPVPLLADPDYGPYCIEPAEMNFETDSLSSEDPFLIQDEDSVVAQSEQKGETPLAETLSRYMQQISETENDPEARKALLVTMLSHEASLISDPNDAAYLVHLSRHLIQQSEDGQRIWPWANEFRKQFSEDPTVTSVVATLGHFLRHYDPLVFEPIISLEEIEKWHRLSILMNPNHPRNHARAANFFLEMQLLSDAERTFSRAFRLDRGDSHTAHQLAELYRETDRPRDAMAVLDMCLRRGSKDPTVAWEAAMTALQLQQFDMMLTYLDRHALVREAAQAWHHYYRALAYLNLKQFNDCLIELDFEEALEPTGSYHLSALRVCAETGLGRIDSAKLHLKDLLKIPLRSVQYLSFHGLVGVTELLTEAILNWPETEPLRKRYFLKTLRAGLLPDRYFQELRDKEPIESDLKFYRIQIRQPLDGSWSESDGCLAHQDDWTEYLLDWGVVARDREDAIRLALSFQGQCELSVPEVLLVDESEETFDESPGILWQGYRRNEDTDLELDLEMEGDEEL